ncbi:MAG: hypothetical protein LBH73_09190 [Spirochaetaceae bacterium]|jgi:hypothetical protein|nr:hypothetical protein [Spirochaetaceae bacterium]
MKRSFLCAVRLGLLFLPLQALELSVGGGFGNLRFDPDQDRSLGAAGESYSPSLYFPVDAVLSGDAFDRFSYTVAFKRGPVLGNQLSALIGVDLGYGSLAVGPVFGLWNNFDEFIKPGLSVQASLDFPGKAFAVLEGNSTLGALVTEDDYAAEYGRIALGFWVPYVVITLNAEREEFLTNKSGGFIRDSRLRYSLNAAAFKKNVPYTIDLDFGYQILAREYNATGDTDSLRSLFLGCEFRTDLRPGFTLILGGEAHLYTWGKDPLKAPQRSTILYEARTGFIWALGD